ncbi:MAG: 4-hydroxythreonine-4-phosphate dehydrogenase PdxA [Kiritimatiellia bacterium]
MPTSSGSDKVVLALTLGDPGGVGPEVALKAVCSGQWPRRLALVLVGDPMVLRDHAKRLALPCPPEISLPLSSGDSLPPAAIWNPLRTSLRWHMGRTNRFHGRAAAAWVAAAVRGCLEGWFDGMVTAPLCKQSLAAAGFSHPGHTEYLAELTNVRRYAMMLIGGRLRVVLATRHLPLRSVAGALTRSAVVDAGMLAARALPWLDGPRARLRPLAVCALNPHAGEGGVLGNEEQRVIQPAVTCLRRQGVDARGPLSADAVFFHARRGDYGAVVAMYHDQGLGPLKTIAFDSGVNLTLGLPLVRTSPDHGTAFDIAGTGLADAGSMRAAVKLAWKLARRPNPWAGAGRRA